MCVVVLSRLKRKGVGSAVVTSGDDDIYQSILVLPPPAAPLAFHTTRSGDRSLLFRALFRTVFAAFFLVFPPCPIPCWIFISRRGPVRHGSCSRSPSFVSANFAHVKNISFWFFENLTLVRCCCCCCCCCVTATRLCPHYVFYCTRGGWLMAKAVFFRRSKGLERQRSRPIRRENRAGRSTSLLHMCRLITRKSDSDAWDKNNCIVLRPSSVFSREKGGACFLVHAAQRRGDISSSPVTDAV